MTVPKILIIIPAYNEEATIAQVIKKTKKFIEKNCINAEIIVINDGSEDRTSLEAQKAGAIVIDLIINLGYWRALQTGMLYGYYKGFEYFITMDADGQHIAEEISKILTPLQQKKADVIIGSCIKRGGISKKIVWAFFRYLTGMKIKDLTSGFRAYNRKSVKYLIDYRYTTFDNADIASLLLLAKNRCKILEIDVNIRERLKGKSKLFSSPLKILKYMLHSLIISISLRSK